MRKNDALQSTNVMQFSDILLNICSGLLALKNFRYIVEIIKCAADVSTTLPRLTAIINRLIIGLTLYIANDSNFLF